MKDAPYDVQFGAHTLHLEPPDLYVITRVGTTSKSEMAASINEIARFAQGKPWILGIVDVRQAGSVPTDAREPWLRLPSNLRGWAFILSKPWQRPVIFAMNASNPAYRNIPSGWCYTEAEARAWIEERRRALQVPG
jgi:hypothetical protein